MGKEKKIRSKGIEMELMSQEMLQRQIVLVGKKDLERYSTMLENCRKHPDAVHWFAPWMMRLRREKLELGNVFFLGIPQKGVAQFSMNMDLGYQDEVLMAEAIRLISDWAMAQTDVFFLETEAGEDMPVLRKALEKAGFTRTDSGIFRKEKPKSSWMAIYMCLGISVGTSLGTASGNLAMGMGLGISVGLLLGSVMDTADRKRRQFLSGQK